MKPELDEMLVKKYPKLFVNKNKSPMETLICFGCECGDGWHQILDHLFGYLTDLMERSLVVDYTEEYKKQHKGKEDYYQKYCSYKFQPPQIILDQVKEKFGTLRVYYHTDFDDVPENVWENLDLSKFYKVMEKYNDEIDCAISYAEYQSSVTCEITGKEGKLYTRGWHQVLCDEEAIKKGYEPNLDGGYLKRENV